MTSSGSGTKDSGERPSKAQLKKWQEGVSYICQRYLERYGRSEGLAVVDEDGLRNLISKNWRDCGAGKSCRCEEIREHLLWPFSCPISHARSVASFAKPRANRETYQKVFLDAVAALQKGESIEQELSDNVQDGACPFQKMHSKLFAEEAEKKEAEKRKRRENTSAESNRKRKRTTNLGEALLPCSVDRSSAQISGVSSLLQPGNPRMPLSGAERAVRPPGPLSTPLSQARVRRTVENAVRDALDRKVHDHPKDVILRQFYDRAGDPLAIRELQRDLQSWDNDGVICPGDHRKPERQIVDLLWDCKEKRDKLFITTQELEEYKATDSLVDAQARSRVHAIALGVLDAFWPKLGLPFSDGELDQLIQAAGLEELETFGDSLGDSLGLGGRKESSVSSLLGGRDGGSGQQTTEGHSALSSSVSGALLDSADLGSVSEKSFVLDGEQQGPYKSGGDILARILAPRGEVLGDNFSEEHLQAPLSRQAPEEDVRYDGARTERTEKDGDCSRGSSEQAVCEEQITSSAAGAWKRSPSTWNSYTGVGGSGVAASSLARCSDDVESGISSLAEENGATQIVMGTGSAETRSTTSDVLHDGKNGSADSDTGNGAQIDGSSGSSEPPPSSQGGHSRLSPQASASVETRTVSGNFTGLQKGNTFERPDTFTGPLLVHTRDAERVCTSREGQGERGGQSPTRSGPAAAHFNNGELAEVLGELKLPEQMTARGTANHNLRQAKSEWEVELTAWIREKEAAQLGVTSLSSPHSDGASTSGSEGAQSRPVEPIELPVKGFTDADLKEPELIDQVQKIVEGVDERAVVKIVTGTVGLRDLLEAKPGRWKQVYNAGGVEPLIGVLNIAEARSSAIVVLGLIMDEALIEAYQKEGGEKVAKDVCENIAVGAWGGLAQILNDKDAERQEKAKAAAILGHCCKVPAIRDLMLRGETGIVLGLVKLSALKKHDEDQGDGSYQELSRSVLCQLAKIPPVEIAEQDGVIRPLLEFSRSQWTRIEALRSLSWLCKETEDELGVGWVAEAVLAKAKGTALLSILPEALEKPALRLPIAQCLARLCQSESLARQLSRTMTRRGTGFEVVLKLLGTVLSAEEGRQPAREMTEGIPPEDHRLCASYLVRIVMSVANADRERNRVLILERGVDLLLRALRMDDSSSGAVALSVARAFEALTKIPHFAEPIISVGGVSGIAVLLHRDTATAEAALEALSSLVDTCPEAAITALRAADGALAHLNCLLTVRGLSCRNAAMKLLLLMEERGNEECSVELAETVSLKAIKPWTIDGVEYKRAASTLAAAMSRHWSDKEEVLRSISLVRGELESALKWHASGDRPTAQPENLSPDNVKVAQAALVALSAMLQRGNHAALLLEAVFPKLASQSQSPKQPPPLWIVLAEALSGPVSLEAARFVALLFESIEADDQGSFVASGDLIEPLLELMTDRAGGEADGGSEPPLEDSGDVTDARETPQSWAYRALKGLVTANLPEPVFRDGHVTALIQCVTEGLDLPYPIRLLHVISGIPGRRPHVREKGLVPLISVVRSSDGAERTTALRILRHLAKDAPAAYAAASADATGVLVEVLGAPRATQDDREMAASAIVVLAKEATGLASLAKHVPALLIPLERPETGEREVGTVLRVLSQLGLVGDFRKGGLIGNEGLVDAILCALRASKKTEEGYHNRRLCVALLNQFVKCRRSEHVGEKIHATDSVASLSSLLVSANGAAEGFLADSAAYLLTNCVATNYPGDCAGVMESLGQLLQGTVGSSKCSHYGLALAEALFKNGNDALRLSLAFYCLSPLENMQNVKQCPASEMAKAVAKSKGKGIEKMIDLPCGNTCVRRTKRLVGSLQKVERDILRKR